MLKKFIQILAVLIISGCAAFDGTNKIVSQGASFITFQVVQGNSDWAKEVAKNHCLKNNKIPYNLPYYDNSLYKEATYFCIDEREQNQISDLLSKLGYEQFFAHMRRTYGGMPSQIQRLGEAAAPLSNLIVQPQTLIPNPIQPIQMLCIKTGESISGMFKTCNYSCGGSPVSNTVRFNEVCELQRKF